jgi:putative endonuclease
MYIGETKELKKRIEYHNLGLQRYTKHGIPWTLIAFVNFTSRDEALKEEKRLKKIKNRSYYKKYIIEHGKKLSG